MSETKREISDRYRRLEQKYERKPVDPGREQEPITTRPSGPGWGAFDL